MEHTLACALREKMHWGRFMYHSFTASRVDGQKNVSKSEGFRWALLSEYQTALQREGGEGKCIPSEIPHVMLFYGT